MQSALKVLICSLKRSDLPSRREGAPEACRTAIHEFIRIKGLLPKLVFSSLKPGLSRNVQAFTAGEWTEVEFGESGEVLLRGPAQSPNVAVESLGLETQVRVYAAIRYTLFENSQNNTFQAFPVVCQNSSKTYAIQNYQNSL